MDGFPVVDIISVRMADLSQYLDEAGRINHIYIAIW